MKEIPDKYAEYDIEYAKLDFGRKYRCGIEEVIYAPGKTYEQIVEIIRAFKRHKQNILITKVPSEIGKKLKRRFPEMVYHKVPGILQLRLESYRKIEGKVAVLCAGTADIPIAEEAAITAEWFGLNVRRIYDIGVAGLHRALRQIPELDDANVIIVVAGMEGALPSVVGGLCDKPIIGVPTSVGYGTNFYGISALLAILNSCVPGIMTVNIDNGFGAAVAAVSICRMLCRAM